MLYWRVRALERRNVQKQSSPSCTEGAATYRCERENADDVSQLLWDRKEMKEIQWETYLLSSTVFCYNGESSLLEEQLWLRCWPKSHMEEAALASEDQLVASMRHLSHEVTGHLCVLLKRFALSDLVDWSENGHWACHPHLISPPSWKWGSIFWHCLYTKMKILHKNNQKWY